MRKIEVRKKFKRFCLFNFEEDGPDGKHSSKRVKFKLSCLILGSERVSIGTVTDVDKPSSIHVRPWTALAATLAVL